MKTIVIALALILASVSARAADLNSVAAAASIQTGHFHNEWIITYEQFVALTPAEQMGYVKGMRTIMSDLSKNSRIFASAKKDPKRAPASTMTVVDPEDAENLMTLYKSWRERGKKGDTVEAVEQSAWYLATAKQMASQLADPNRRYLFDETIALEQADVTARARKLARGASAPDAQRLADVEALQAKLKTPDAAAIRDVRVPYDKLQKPDGGRLMANVEDLNNPDHLVPPADIPNPAPGAKRAWKAPAGAEKRPDGTFYRCLYAGFVLKGDPCAAPAKLPDGFNIADIPADAFACGPKETLCNPFLYGMKSDCKPGPDKTDESNRACLAKSKGLCIPNATPASPDCAKAAGGDDSLRSAVALIRLNAVSFVKFRQGFHELCDARMIEMNGLSYWKNGSPRELPEKTKAELDQTCGQARTQMKALADKYGVAWEPLLRRDGGTKGAPEGRTGTPGTK